MVGWREFLEKVVENEDLTTAQMLLERYEPSLAEDAMRRQDLSVLDDI
jgi:hypothetical protein